MIISKTAVVAALAATPAAAALVAPAFDWNPIITALIVAVPNTLLIYFQCRKIVKSVDGVVTKLMTENTKAAAAEAQAEAAPTILKLSTDKATAEATIEAGLKHERQDKAAKPKTRKRKGKT